MEYIKSIYISQQAGFAPWGLSGDGLSSMAGSRVHELWVVSHLERCWSQPAGVWESSKGLSCYCSSLSQEMLGFSQKYVSILQTKFVTTLNFGGEMSSNSGAAEGGNSWNHRAGLRRCGRECTITIPLRLMSVHGAPQSDSVVTSCLSAANRLMLCSSCNLREVFGYLIIMVLLNVNNMYQEGFFNCAIHQVILHTTSYWNSVQ